MKYNCKAFEGARDEAKRCGLSNATPPVDVFSILKSSETGIPFEGILNVRELERYSEIVNVEVNIPLDVLCKFKLGCLGIPEGFKIKSSFDVDVFVQCYYTMWF